MKRLDEMTEEELRRATRWGVVTALLAGVFLVIPNLALFETNALDLELGSMSMFAGVRSILVVFFFSAFLPGSILTEFGESRMFNRSFRPRNILIFLLLYGEVILTSVVLLTIFDLPLAKASVLVQAPLTSICLGISILLMAATFRVRRFNNFFKKAFS